MSGSTTRPWRTVKYCSSRRNLRRSRSRSFWGIVVWISCRIKKQTRLLVLTGSAVPPGLRPKLRDLTRDKSPAIVTWDPSGLSDRWLLSRLHTCRPGFNYHLNSCPEFWRRAIHSSQPNRMAEVFASERSTERYLGNGAGQCNPGAKTIPCADGARGGAPPEVARFASAISVRGQRDDTARTPSAPSEITQPGP